MSLRRSLVLSLSLMLLAGGAAASAEPPSLAGLELVATAAGADSAPVPSEITVRTVTVQAGDRIADLLRAGRIAAGAGAFSVVYLLNPDLERLDPLPAGARLALPAAAGERLPPGSLVRLDVAPGIQRELLASDLSLGPVVERVNLLPDARFEGADEKEAVVGALDEIRGFLDLLNAAIHDHSTPFHPEVLRQALGETRLVQEILDGMVRSGRALSAAERETLVRISEDMNRKAVSFDEMRRGGGLPPRWRDARVVVRLAGAEDGAPVSGLRVYYVPRALAGRPGEVRHLPGLGSEAAARLPEADYLVWAGTVASPAPLSPEVPVEVRRGSGGGEIRVDLRIPRGRTAPP